MDRAATNHSMSSKIISASSASVVVSLEIHGPLAVLEGFTVLVTEEDWS